MTSGEFPFRLVLHELPDGRSHLDLFIDVLPTEDLTTYELPREFLSELRQGENRLEARIDEITGPSDSGSYPAVLKKPHRRKYWTYEGPISGNRGQIKEIARGIIRGGPWMDGLRVRIAPTE